MPDKKYVGNGKIGKFDQIRIGIRYADLKPNERGYVNLIVAPVREPDEKRTHTVYVDDFVPRSTPKDDMPF